MSNRTLPSIDVVIPVSRMWYLPYLENSLRSIRRQDYPQDLLGITISFVAEDPGEDIGELCDLCRELDASIVFTHPEDPSFNISKAYNAGARSGSREAIACLDADIVFGRQTFAFAASVLKQGKLAIVPVVYMSQQAESEFFRETVPAMTEEQWLAQTGKMACRRDANGNIFVPRNVFEYLRGYDERFYGWGAADHDFFVRANHLQGAVHMMDTECPKSMHQSHRPRADVESEHTRRNRTLMEQSKTKRRNPERWGRIDNGAVLPTFSAPETEAERKQVNPYNRTFVGVPAQHALATYDAIESIITAHPHIRRIVELGTADGALSLYLGLWGKRLGIPVYTVDSRPAVYSRPDMQKTLRELGVQFVRINILKDHGLAAARTMVEGCAVYLICDNGNKTREFNQLVPHLLPGSVVSVHDWGTEVLGANIEQVRKNSGLVPFQKDRWERNNLKMATWTVPGDPVVTVSSPPLVIASDWPPGGADWHRKAVGGSWEQMGNAQLSLLKSRGLEPHHKLLEVGCGCLRFGTKAISYLDKGCYVGLEPDKDLLEAGRTIELPKVEACKGKEPRFLNNADFDMSELNQDERFDFAMSQSVFTHIPITAIELCVERVIARLRPGGKFCATYNDSPQGWFQFGAPYPRMTSYPSSMFKDMGFRHGAEVEVVGDWGIPQNARGEQLLVIFKKK
jgi:predicted O-methyltransferase YrrM